MKKISIILLSALVVLFCISCESSNDYQDKAKEFLNMYYSQYEKKDEIAEIIDYNVTEYIDTEEKEPTIVSNTYQEQMIKEFIDGNFNDILTEEAKDILVANRLIPKTDVLDSDIVKATIVSIEFDEAESEEEDSLSFSANIDYEHENGNESNSSEKGWIRIIEDEGILKVDGFKLY